MKLLSRDFSIKEKVLIAILVVIILALAYYQFVDVPVRSGIERAKSQQEALETELVAVQARVVRLRKMQAEIDKIKEDGTFKPMPSYNNSKEVTQLLNNVLGDIGYRISFASVKADGNLVRRTLTLEFTARDYVEIRRVLSGIADGEYRCLIGNVSCSKKWNSNIERNELRVTAVITFYETTVDGTADQGIN